MKNMFKNLKNIKQRHKMNENMGNLREINLKYKKEQNRYSINANNNF